MNKQTLLVIDDEPQIRKLLEITFESNQYAVLLADNAKQGLALAASYKPNLIVLDLELPDKHGLTVLQELRQWYEQAILILSVVDAEDAIVHALDHGASDYLTKPFRTAELLARVRHAIRHNKSDAAIDLCLTGNLEIDIAAGTVKKNHELIKLTATEFKLLALFAKNQGRVLTQTFILKEIWGTGAQNEAQYLRVFVGTLRKKIEDDPARPMHIITENGIGYRFA